MRSVFKSYWTDGKDISIKENLFQIAESHGAIKEIFENFIENQKIKDRLTENTQELMDRGGFGSPTFFIDQHDMYFGNDRLQLIEEKL